MRNIQAFLVMGLIVFSACTRKTSETSATTQMTTAERGKLLLSSKGCLACHTVDGPKMSGPTYKGLYGSDVKLADGSIVKADDAYLRESIETPTAKLVEGFPPSMPPYKGMISDAEISDIIEYIKTLK